MRGPIRSWPRLSLAVCAGRASAPAGGSTAAHGRVNTDALKTRCPPSTACSRTSSTSTRLRLRRSSGRSSALADWLVGLRRRRHRRRRERRRARRGCAWPTARWRVRRRRHRRRRQRRRRRSCSAPARALRRLQVRPRPGLPATGVRRSLLVVLVVVLLLALLAERGVDACMSNLLTRHRVPAAARRASSCALLPKSRPALAASGSRAAFTAVDLALAAWLVGALRPRRGAAMQFAVDVRVGAAGGHPLPPGRRRHLASRCSSLSALLDASSRSSPRGRSTTSRAKFYFAMLLLLAGGHERRVLRAGLRALLRVLGARARPDVLPHRHVGRRRAASTPSIKFFLYTLFGSVFMLVGIIALYLQRRGTFDMIAACAAWAPAPRRLGSSGGCSLRSSSASR